jgi:tripartite-type tricarboxylate transporter receptor subunit TctC
VEDYVGFAVKSGTPQEIVARLNEAVNSALQKPRVLETFAKLGATPAGGTADDFAKLIKAQVAHWGRVVRDSGIKMPQ